MRIEVMSGQPKIKLDGIFCKLVNDAQPNTSIVCRYPEMEIRQPRELFDYIKDLTESHIKNDRDLFILTYSDHVLNAIRVSVKHLEFHGAKVHQIRKDGYDVCAGIDADGRLTEWLPDVFDVAETALLELQ
jgi:hypothetical protein